MRIAALRREGLTHSSGQAPAAKNCFVASTLKTMGVRCPFVVRYPAFIEAPRIGGGRAEVNENDCRYRSGHTARKGELQTLLIGADSRAPDIGIGGDEFCEGDLLEDLGHGELFLRLRWR
jgi:hypothetical protein